MFLAHTLDAAISTATFVEQELRDPNYKGAEGRELWFMWVAIIEHTLQHCGIQTSARSDSDKQQKQSIFVDFVEQIQSYLPPDCRKYHTGGSIAKGIQRARGEYPSRGLDIVLLFLVEFSLGWVEMKDGRAKKTRLFGRDAHRLAYYYPQGSVPTVKHASAAAELTSFVNQLSETDANNGGSRERKRAKKA
jgi:hypothetical protein